MAPITYYASRNVSHQLLRELRSADDFYEYESWPKWAQHAFIDPHKRFAERRNLWMFLWKNGMEPSRAKYYVLWHRTYDNAAILQVQDLVNKSHKEEGRQYLARFKTYNMEWDPTDPNSKKFD